MEIERLTGRMTPQSSRNNFHAEKSVGNQLIHFCNQLSLGISNTFYAATYVMIFQS